MIKLPPSTCISHDTLLQIVVEKLDMMKYRYIVRAILGHLIGQSSLTHDGDGHSKRYTNWCPLFPKAYVHLVLDHSLFLAELYLILDLPEQKIVTDPHAGHANPKPEPKPVDRNVT